MFAHYQMKNTILDKFFFGAVRWVDGKMIAVKDGNFLEEEDGKIKVTALKDAQEIKQKLTEYFPEIDRSTIDAAIEHWVHHIQKCGQAGHGWGFYKQGT